MFHSLFSRVTHVVLLTTQLCDCNFLPLYPQDHLLKRNPPDNINQDAGDQTHGIKLVDEPHINNSYKEDGTVHDTDFSSNIQMFDENIVQKNAADSTVHIVVNTAMPDSLTQMHEVKARNVTLQMDENIIPSMATKEHLETNSLLRNNEEGRHSSLQQRESPPSVPATGTGNIIYGSDHRIYRIHEGLPGPTGPRGRRVSISLG